MQDERGVCNGLIFCSLTGKNEWKVRHFDTLTNCMIEPHKSIGVIKFVGLIIKQLYM